MERRAKVCAEAVKAVAAGAAIVALAILAGPQRQAAGQNSTASTATPRTNAPIVIASGVTARALALQPADPAAPGATANSSANKSRAPIYLTTPALPNRIFELRPGMQGNAAAQGSVSDLSAAAQIGLASIAGNGAAGSLGDGGAAAAAQFNLKLDSAEERSGIAIAADGTIFVADTLNSTVRRIAGPESSEPGVIRSVTGRWAPAQNVQLVAPMGLALDTAGNLYIADHDANAIFVLHAAAAATPGALELFAHVIEPVSVAVAREGGKVFAALNGTGAVISIDAKTRAPQQIFGCTAKAPDCTASGLAVDGAGNLFVSNSAGNRIFRVDAATQKLSVAASGLNWPGEMAMDANGNLFVADQGKERILEIQQLGAPANGLTLAPGTKDFGVEPTNGTSPTSAFTFTNSTSGPLTNLSIGFLGLNPLDFANKSSSCTTQLAANSSCTINVAFVPQDTGSRQATLAVAAKDAGGNASLETASVSGTGALYFIQSADGQLSVTVLAGNHATYNLEVIPDMNFPGGAATETVTFICPKKMPRGTECSFAPASAPIVAGTPLPFVLTIKTTSPTTGKTGQLPPSLFPLGRFPRGRIPGVPLPLAPMGTALAAIAIFAAIRFARRACKCNGRRRAISILAASAFAAAFVGGCQNYNSVNTIVNGTPNGTTIFIAQAGVQDASGASLNATTGITLTLVVQ